MARQVRMGKCKEAQRELTLQTRKYRKSDLDISVILGRTVIE